MQYKPQVEIIRNYDYHPFLYRHFIVDATMMDGGRINVQIEVGIKPVIIVIHRVVEYSVGFGIKIFGVLFQTTISW